MSEPKRRRRPVVIQEATLATEEAKSVTESTPTTVSQELPYQPQNAARTKQRSTRENIRKKHKNKTSLILPICILLILIIALILLIKFGIICVHGETVINNATAASCVSEGYTGDTQCVLCNKTLNSGSSIPRLEHNINLVNIKEATCLNEGYSGDMACIDCGWLSQEGSVLPALDEHQFVDNTCIICEWKRPGLYQNGVLTKTWDDLKKENLITLYKYADSEITGEVGLRWIDKNISGLLVIDEEVVFIGIRCCAAEKPLSVYLPRTLKNIDYDVFENCIGLKSVRFFGVPKNEKGGTFSGCINLEEVILADGWETIQNDTFFMCESLKTIVMPESVKHIESSAFRGCTELRELTLHEGISSIGDYAFSNCGIEEIVLPASITAYKAFSSQYIAPSYHFNYNYTDCPNLKKVDLSKTRLTNLYLVFNGCNSLEEIILPESIQYMNDVFGGAVSLEELVIPSNGKELSIASRGWGDLTSLRRIVWPKELDDVSLGNCSNLETIYYAGNQQEWNEIVKKVGADIFQNVEIVYNYGE